MILRKVACAVAFLTGCLIALTASPPSRVAAAPVPKEIQCIDCKCVKLLEGFAEYTVNPGLWVLGTGTGSTDDPFVATPSDFGSLKLPTYDPERILISTGYTDGGPVSGEITRRSMGFAAIDCPPPDGVDTATTRMRLRAKNFANPEDTYLPVKKFICRAIATPTIPPDQGQP